MKNNLPIEDQVITKDQADELTRLLGDYAPESVWVWVKPRNDQNYRLMLSDDFDNNYSDFYEDDYYPAYGRRARDIIGKRSNLAGLLPSKFHG